MRAQHPENSFANVAHGTILGGLSVVPDLTKAITAYRDILQLNLVAQTTVDDRQAASWGCPKTAGAKMAVLRPSSGEPCWFRLVEQPNHPEFRPTRSYGWAAFETTVEDVWHWPDALPKELFEIIGPPRKLKGVSSTFIPMQALGPGKELIYLNQVLSDPSDALLPRAHAPVDRIFIVVLAAPDREESCQFYTKNIGLDRGPDYTLAYSTINKAFGLPAETKTTISMIHRGLHPIVEIDDYPIETTARARHDGMLPPGNAVVTLAVDNLNNCDVNWITEPAHNAAAPYMRGRAGCTIGPAGELIELVETGELVPNAQRTNK